VTDNQQRAIDAIKAATGWDAEPSSQGAKVQRPNVTSIYVWWSRSDRWKCEISPKGWTGEGATPEEAIDAVLPRYRAQIASLAADILPGWPKLEWQRDAAGCPCLYLIIGGLCQQITRLQLPDPPYLCEAKNLGFVGTIDEVLARVKGHVESLGLPCSLPPFPETPNA